MGTKMLTCASRFHCTDSSLCYFDTIFQQKVRLGIMRWLTCHNNLLNWIPVKQQATAKVAVTGMICLVKIDLIGITNSVAVGSYSPTRICFPNCCQ